MDEADWDRCTVPEAMLRWLQSAGWLTGRKARLFAVACCRRIWPLLTDERSRRAVEVAERYADGAVADAVLQTSSAAADTAEQAAYGAFSPADRRLAILEQAERSPWDAALAAPRAAVQCAQPVCGGHYGVDVGWSCVEATAWAAIAGDANAWDAAIVAEHAAQADLVRDLFGPLPFRPVTIEASWRTPNVVTLGQTVYDLAAFDRLAELADALSAAGCTDADILGHLRGPGPHVRGCWTLDAVLGKS